MSSRIALALVAGVACSATVTSAAQDLRLDSIQGLTLHNVQAEPATLDGKRGVRVTVSADARQRLKDQPAGQQTFLETLAVIADSDFTNGVIEVEIAGAPASDAPEAARGFVGIAFRVKPDLQTYD